VKLVRLDETRAGHRVARDVVDVRGNLLLKAGTALAPDLIQRLRAWRVTHLFIDDAPTATLDPGERPAARSGAIDRELDSVFSEARAHPVMQRLRDAAARYLKGRIR
jgi:hypothetical protein